MEPLVTDEPTPWRMLATPTLATYTPTHTLTWEGHTYAGATACMRPTPTHTLTWDGHTYAGATETYTYTYADLGWSHLRWRHCESNYGTCVSSGGPNNVFYTSVI